MKRFSIIFLGLLIALMTASGISAKTKARKSTTTTASIPSVQTIEKLIKKLAISNHPARVAAPAGMKLLAKKTARDGDIEEVLVVYGNNAKATIGNKRWTINATATGSHAWYFEYFGSGDSYYGIFFSSEADRDAFWEEFKNSSIFYNEEIIDFYGSEECYLTTGDGWYGINLDPH